MGNAESDVPTPVERKRRSTSASAESTLALCCSRALTDVGSGSRAPVRAVAPRARTHAVGAHFSHRVTSKYDIKALIGRGSFSTVVRAEHKTTREPRAIKIVDVREDSFDSIKTELTILRQVRHPHVIVLYEAFVTNKCVYMVMELATGGELFDRVLAQGGRYPEREAGQVTGMIVDGVRYLHSVGITHRDLKPENILYYHPGRDSRVVISDFGLSHVVGSKESSESSENVMRTTCGTPEYIAPEIILRQAYSRAVDMWAVGVIVYVLLSGLMPFKDDGNRKNLYRRIIKADYNYDAQPWRGVSGTAKDFVDRLLTLEPLTRMTAEESMSHRWIVALQKTALAPLPSPIDKDILSGKRKPVKNKKRTSSRGSP